MKQVKLPMRQMKKKTRIINIKFFVFLIQRMWADVSLWAGKWIELIGPEVDACIRLVDCGGDFEFASGRLVEACLFAMILFHSLWAVFLKANVVAHNLIFFHIFSLLATFVIGSFYIVFYNFWGDLFCVPDVMFRATAQKMIFLFLFLLSFRK